MMSIQLLSDNLVNKIAAGEVIERPASIVKELIENSLDAGATKIHIYVKDAGRNILRVTDNGKGIAKEELHLALTRYATSKLTEDTLFLIDTLGFRGEALASIVAVSRLRLSSKQINSQTGWAVEAELGKMSDPFPISQNEGTQIEISDLFFSTPVRLKFMKSDKAEHMAVTQTVINLALAYPHIDFVLQINDTPPQRFVGTATQEGLPHRLTRIIAKDFITNAVIVDVKRENMHLHGYIGLPSYHSAKPHHQYFYVNNRWVKDKLLFGAIKAGYGDLLPKAKHSIYALFLDLPVGDVDVNVHPAKYEIRFRHPAMVRSCIVNAIQLSLHNDEAKRTSEHLASEVVNAFQREGGPNQTMDSSLNIMKENRKKTSFFNNSVNKQKHFQHPRMTNNKGDANVDVSSIATQASYGLYKTNTLNDYAVQDGKDYQAETELPSQWNDFPLGMAKAQIHNNYIVSQTSQSMIIVDQHAAHERIIYEKLKQQYRNQGIRVQQCLVPEIMQLSEHDKDKLLSYVEVLNRCGICVENFGQDAIIVRELPALLGNENSEQLIKDIIAEIHGNNGVVHDNLEEIEEVIFAILSRIACYGSVRSGRSLQIDEMNALLREMEMVDNTNACNHGRPTYIELSLKDIEKWFERT